MLKKTCRNQSEEALMAPANFFNILNDTTSCKKVFCEKDSLVLYRLKEKNNTLKFKFAQFPTRERIKTKTSKVFSYRRKLC